MDFTKWPGKDGGSPRKVSESSKDSVDPWHANLTTGAIAPFSETRVRERPRPGDLMSSLNVELSWHISVYGRSLHPLFKRFVPKRFCAARYSETPENLRHCLYVVARTEPTS